MSQNDLLFGVVFTADNKELVAATRENVGATQGYVAALKNATPSTSALGAASADTARQMASAATAVGAQTTELNQLRTAATSNAAGLGRVSANSVVLAGSAKGAAQELKNMRIAGVQTGQQLQDIAVGFQSGQRGATIFAQQLPQLAFALSGVGGRVGALATALSGPAGLLLIPLGAIIGTWIDKMFGLGEASAGASSDLEKVTFASYAFKDAQGILGNVLDLTTGKITTQSKELLALAQAQILVARVQAQARAVEAKKGVKDIQYRESEFNGGLGGGFSITRRKRDARDVISEQVLDGTLDAKTAVNRLENLRKIGLLTEEQFVAAASAVANLGVELENIKVFDKADKLLNGTGGRDLIKPKKDKKPKAERTTAGDLTQFDYPFAASTITSGYGRRKPPKNGASSNHLALDFGAAEGTPIKAQVAGIVSFAGNAGGYGNQIQLNHGAGTQTRYSHLSRFGVKDGQRVEKGDTIGYVGKTGTATGAHLHYEVLVNGKKVDPSKKLFATDETAVADSAQAVFEKLEDFGDQAADRIAQVKGQFDTVPRDVDAAYKAIDDINELIADLEKREPPGFEAMIADAKKLAPLIKDSLRRPILDMLRDQDRQIAIGEALLSNDQGRADAMQVTLQLMQRFGVENEAQLATELARRGITGDQIRDYYRQLDVLQDQGRALDVLRQKQEVNLQFLAEFQGGLRDSIRGILGGEGLSALSKGLDRIFEGYLDALADQLSETLFGDIFRKQQDKVTGVGPVKEAGEKLAVQVDLAKTQVSALVVEIDNTSAALGGLVDAIQGASSDINAAATNAVADGAAADNAQQTTSDDQLDQGILVLADRDVAKTAKSTLQQLFEGLFGEDSPAAAQLAKIIPLLFQGAAEGQAASGILGSLGVKQSKLGAQIGGAAGKAIGTYFGGPLGGKIGGFIGGTIGGTIGGLFKKSKTGSATLSFTDGQLVSGAVGGNNKKLQGRAGELIGGVGTSLTSIAEQLGGFLSDRAAVSIGYDKKGRVVVDPTGQNRTKGSGVKNFGKDGEEAARAFAVLDALKDGAVAGLSDKVAQALRSSDDLEKAIREAVKVDEIEQILNGFGGASKRVFVDFERQAKERLRVAGKYGFDLVKLEEENQKQRKKLLEDSIEQATGGLKALLEDLISGAKAPGTLLDRRAALLTRKAELERLAPTDADAAAKLADVLEQLYQVSLEAFGTAGAQFAGDRSGIQSSAEAIIAAATAELTAAQNAARNGAGTDSSSTDRLIGTGNAVLTQIQQLTDENNSQSAEMIALLARISEGVRQDAQDSGAIGRAYDIGTMSF